MLISELSHVPEFRASEGISAAKASHARIIVRIPMRAWENTHRSTCSAPGCSPHQVILKERSGLWLSVLEANGYLAQALSSLAVRSCSWGHGMVSIGAGRTEPTEQSVEQVEEPD